MENEMVHWSNPAIPSILSSTTWARMSDWPFFINLVVTVTLDEATDLLINNGYPAIQYSSPKLFSGPTALSSLSMNWSPKRSVVMGKRLWDLPSGYKTLQHTL